MFRYRPNVFLLVIIFLLTACAGNQITQGDTPVFRHDIPGQATPWTHSDFDNGESKFTFALFSDLTGGEREGVFEVAIAQINLLRPELIVNVGDLIEGGTTDREQLTREWDSFDQRAGRARAPVFYTGGNHDLTHPEMWKFWDERYGKRYYTLFIKRSCSWYWTPKTTRPKSKSKFSRFVKRPCVLLKLKAGAFLKQRNTAN